MRFPGFPAHPPHVRAADADRERVADHLRTQCGEGRLEPHELEERLERAYRARTYGELHPLTADLPAARELPGAPRRPSRVAGVMAVAAVLGLCAVMLAVLPPFLATLTFLVLAILAGFFGLFALTAFGVALCIAGARHLLFRLAAGLGRPPLHRLP